MDEQNKNLLLATSLSFLVLVGWMLLFPPQEIDPVVTDDSEKASTNSSGFETNTIDSFKPLNSDLLENKELKRIPIETARLSGSISLRGGRIDDLKLVDYFEDQSPDSNNVVILKPTSVDKSYYAVYGWTPVDGIYMDEVPNANTKWSLVSGRTLTEFDPITIQWTNKNGVVFQRNISIDENFMFSIEQSVLNKTSKTIKVAPYGIIARHGQPETIGFYILHEGVVGNKDGELIERKYKKMPDQPFIKNENGHVQLDSIQQNGWIGFTDKYWMTTMIPQPGQSFRMATKYTPQTDTFQTDMRLPSIEVFPNQQSIIRTNFFAGAKEVNTIKKYQKELGVENFVDSVDWGWFFFLTKPIASMLSFFNDLTGNMGWSIILLTLVIKTALFPLAYKSWVSMAKMKKLQPEMEKIKERVGDDRMKMQQELMAMYKKEKINPVAGCLPILPQIPIFFSLYKVLFVTIEVRHAPFIGWITDLSAPDPSSFLNLFGLLPFSPPDPGSFFAIFSIGVYPILMGVTMWLQQKLNPAPTDKTQAMIFAWMPWVFMFMLGQFASGLVLYWVANNAITFVQQYAIMASQGVKPDIFGNIISSFRKTKDT
ncbi:MAG: membrane protein insertase YidC [Pseudomonadota bacterium]|nr:membrane protein insertase YidC [Pseudomonadota bacterium]